MTDIIARIFLTIVCFGLPALLFWPGSIARAMWSDFLGALEHGPTDSKYVYGFCAITVTLCCVALVGLGTRVLFSFFGFPLS